MDLHNDLPFSSIDFFVYSGISVALMLLVKLFFKDKIAFKYPIALINLGYIILLFPKPFQLIGLILFLYLAILGLRKWYKRKNIIFPMLLLAVPIFLMKTFVLFPEEGATTFVRDFKDIIQIAGLSYIVFKTIGLYIDLRKKTDKISLIAFFNFTAFVPTLLIGPLDRIGRFNKDIEKGYENINLEKYGKAWDKLLKGLAFKFIIAELIRRFVLSELVDDGSMIYHVTYAYTYLIYLFFDFAGYSLLAISLGNFLGVDVPINFDKPFLAVNPKEFWKRWHKSLGDWLGDYFFKPIFKELTSKKVFTSIRRQNIALFLTFTLMGFWNGFQLHYIVSGVVFGLYSVIHNSYVYRCKKNKRDILFGSLKPVWVKVLSILILFNAVTFAIYIFSGKIM